MVFLMITVLVVLVGFSLFFFSVFLGGIVELGLLKMSSFECGFESMSGARFPFSLQFFLIAVVFLVFDVEISLILPVVVLVEMWGVCIFVSSFVFFIFFVLLGLYFEWWFGCLSWVY